jgi:hypothetical protein
MDAVLSAVTRGPVVAVELVGERMSYPARYASVAASAAMPTSVQSSAS